MGNIQTGDGAVADLLAQILNQQGNPEVDKINALGQMNQAQLAQLLPTLAGDNKLQRTPGGFDLPAPNNLDTFYDNNPNVARGEFDSTGEKAQQRGALAQSTQDLGASNDNLEARIHKRLRQMMFGSLEEGGGGQPQAQPQKEPGINDLGGAGQQNYGPGNVDGVLEAFSQPQGQLAGNAQPSRLEEMSGAFTGSPVFPMPNGPAGGVVNPPQPQLGPGNTAGEAENVRQGINQPNPFAAFFGDNPQLESITGPSPATPIDYGAELFKTTSRQQSPIEGAKGIQRLNRQNAENVADVGQAQAKLYNNLFRLLGGGVAGQGLAPIAGQQIIEQGPQNLLNLFR